MLIIYKNYFGFDCILIAIKLFDKKNCASLQVMICVNGNRIHVNYCFICSLIEQTESCTLEIMFYLQENQVLVLELGILLYLCGALNITFRRTCWIAACTLGMFYM